MPYNFSWVVEGRLAASGAPGGGAFYGGSLMDDLRMFSEQGIGLIVSLTEQPLDAGALAAAHLTAMHLPVPDMTAPSLQTVDMFLSAAESVEAEGQASLVHCRAGLGRTGTLVACYLSRDGMTGDEAIQRVRQLRPGSIETAEQENTVRDFAARYARQKQQA